MARRKKKCAPVVDLHTEKCVADDCPRDAVRTVEIEGEPYRVCERHAEAVEVQKRRNVEAKLGVAK